MNVLVLLAGASAGFKEAGYLFPKPLVEIAGQPLVQHVIRHFTPLVEAGARLIFLIRHDDNLRYHIASVVKLLAPTAEVREVRGETAGAACSALLAVDLINRAEPLVIVNGDQLIEANLAAITGDFAARRLDGGIIIFPDVHPRWSFVKCDADGNVIETAEKRPISNLATAGFYYFASGAAFVEAAQAMILKDAAVNGMFYVCPVYNELILRNRRIGVHRIAKAQYVSLASPQGVQEYERRLTEQPPRTTR